VLLQAAFRRMADDGFVACAIEASSIGIVEQRLAGTRIEVALFTNFTRDHLDYHGSMDNYWAAKRLLFGWVGLKSAVINIDDDAGALLADELRRGQIDSWTYSTRADSGARLIAEDIGYATAACVHAGRGRGRRRPRAPRAGHTDADRRLQRAQPAGRHRRPARAGRHDGRRRARGRARHAGAGAHAARAAGAVGQPEVVVDYAHTPDALEKVVAALRRWPPRAAASWSACSAAAATATPPSVR
jgi:UDP-N-acetylmuramate-alanine ligase